MKILSKNNAELKLVFPLLLSLFGSVVVFAVLSEYSRVKYIFSILIFILGIAWTYRRYINSYNLFYNEENLILKNKKVQRHIDLVKVNRIKLTLSEMRIWDFSSMNTKLILRMRWGHLKQ